MFVCLRANERTHAALLCAIECRGKIFGTIFAIFVTWKTFNQNHLRFWRLFPVLSFYKSTSTSLCAWCAEFAYENTRQVEHKPRTHSNLFGRMSICLLACLPGCLRGEGLTSVRHRYHFGARKCVIYDVTMIYIAHKHTFMAHIYYVEHDIGYATSEWIHTKMNS